MNSDTKTLDRNPVSSPVPCNAVLPQMGSLSKEVPPVAVVSELKPAGQEVKHAIGKELIDLGVKEISGRLDLTPEHKELGLGHAGESTPAPSSASGKVTMPMSEEEIANKLKVGQDDDSGKWQAVLLKKIIDIMSFKI